MEYFSDLTGAKKKILIYSMSTDLKFKRKKHYICIKTFLLLCLTCMSCSCIEERGYLQRINSVFNTGFIKSVVFVLVEILSAAFLTRQK